MFSRCTRQERWGWFGAGGVIPLERCERLTPERTAKVSKLGHQNTAAGKVAQPAEIPYSSLQSVKGKIKSESH